MGVATRLSVAAISLAMLDPGTLGDSWNGTGVDGYVRPSAADVSSATTSWACMRTDRVVSWAKSVMDCHGKE